MIEEFSNHKISILTARFLGPAWFSTFIRRKWSDLLFFRQFQKCNQGIQFFQETFLAVHKCKFIIFFQCLFEIQKIWRSNGKFLYKWQMQARYSKQIVFFLIKVGLGMSFDLLCFWMMKQVNKKIQKSARQNTKKK